MSQEKCPVLFVHHDCWKPGNIRKYDPDDGSHGKRMSKYVGKLEVSNIPYDISWSILLRAPTYSPITKSCRLCLLEKYFIMFDSAGATLNVKSEFFSTCLDINRIYKNGREWIRFSWCDYEVIICILCLCNQVTSDDCRTKDHTHPLCRVKNILGYSRFKTRNILAQ